MTIDKKLMHAGILISRDQADVEHIRFVPGNKFRIRRFTAFQQAVIEQPLGQTGLTCACLIAFDLVPPQHIPIALLSDPYCYLGSIHLDWEQSADERLDRRRLSAMTLLNWNHSVADKEQEWSAFSDWLCTLDGYKTMTIKVALDELELDLYSWTVRKMPMSMFAHVIGLRPMTALPRDTLARASSGMVPALLLDETSIERETKVADFMDVVDEVNEEKCQLENDGMVRMAIKMLTTRKGETPNYAIDRWVTGLLNLRPRVLRTNIATAMVLSWMLDLCESGTARKSNADYLTRKRYCVATAFPLWRMLSTLGGHPESWDAEVFKAGLWT